MSSPRAALVPDMETCTDCFTGTIHTAQPVGHLETIHNVPTYITRGSAPSNSTIIFLTDGFGFNLVNNKLLADQYASRTGLRVLMPNLLPNGGVPLVMMRLSDGMTTPTPWWNLVRQARRVWAGCRLLTILIPFGFKVKRLYPTVLAYVRAVRASLPLGAKLGIAGFCLGGHWSSRICSEPAHETHAHNHHHRYAGDNDDDNDNDNDDGQGDGGGGGGGDDPTRDENTTLGHNPASHLIDAHFTAHPSNVSPEDAAAFARRFRVPWSMALGGRDMMMPAAQAHGIEARLREVYRAEPAKLQVEVYDQCGHGFALRADPHKREENDGAERALEQAVVWFRRYL